MFNYLSRKSKNKYINYLIFLDKYRQANKTKVPMKQEHGYAYKVGNTKTGRGWYTHYLKKIVMFNGKKKQLRRFSGYRFFLHRFRLHINFKYFFSGYYKIRQRVLKKKRRQRRYQKKGTNFLYSSKKSPLRRYYLKHFREQRSRHKWRYFFKRRYLLHNAGYRFRQRLLAQVQQMRFFFRYNVHHVPGRNKIWHRFKFFVNYRRTPLKFEKKKK